VLRFLHAACVHTHYMYIHATCKHRVEKVLTRNYVVMCHCLSGFTPDVKVWEVCFDKSGNFQDVRRAFELKGHMAGVHWFAFSADSHRSVAMTTVSESDAVSLYNSSHC